MGRHRFPRQRGRGAGEQSRPGAPWAGFQLWDFHALQSACLEPFVRSVESEGFQKNKLYGQQKLLLTPLQRFQAPCQPGGRTQPPRRRPCPWPLSTEGISGAVKGSFQPRLHRHGSCPGPKAHQQQGGTQILRFFAPCSSPGTVDTKHHLMELHASTGAPVLNTLRVPAPDYTLMHMSPFSVHTGNTQKNASKL